MSRASRQERLQQVRRDEEEIVEGCMRIRDKISDLLAFFDADTEIYRELKEAADRVNGLFDTSRMRIFVDGQEDSQATWGMGVSPIRAQGRRDFQLYFNAAATKHGEIANEQLQVRTLMEAQKNHNEFDAIHALRAMKSEVESLLEIAYIKAAQIYDVLSAPNQGLSDYQFDNGVFSDVGLVEAAWDIHNYDVGDARDSIRSLDQRVASQEVIVPKITNIREKVKQVRDKWSDLALEMNNKFEVYKETRAVTAQNAAFPGRAPAPGDNSNTFGTNNGNEGRE